MYVWLFTTMSSNNSSFPVLPSHAIPHLSSEFQLPSSCTYSTSPLDGPTGISKLAQSSAHCHFPKYSPLLRPIPGNHTSIHLLIRIRKFTSPLVNTKSCNYILQIALKSDQFLTPSSTHHLSFPHQTFCGSLRTCPFPGLAHARHQSHL